MKNDLYSRLYIDAHLCRPECGDTIQIVRQLSSVEYRHCRDCNSGFFIETVEWTTHSFTVVDNQLARDRYYYKCPTHYGPQDPNMMFV